MCVHPIMYCEYVYICTCIQAKPGACLSGMNVHVYMYVYMYMYMYVPHLLDCGKRVLFIVVATPTVATVAPPDATRSMAALSVL